MLDVNSLGAHDVREAKHELKQSLHGLPRDLNCVRNSALTGSNEATLGDILATYT